MENATKAKSAKLSTQEATRETWTRRRRRMCVCVCVRCLLRVWLRHADLGPSGAFAM